LVATGILHKLKSSKTAADFNKIICVFSGARWTFNKKRYGNAGNAGPGICIKARRKARRPKEDAARTQKDAAQVQEAALCGRKSLKEALVEAWKANRSDRRRALGLAFRAKPLRERRHFLFGRESIMLSPEGEQCMIELIYPNFCIHFSG
jgi:hypothetical protein